MIIGLARSLALCLVECLPPVGSQGTIIKVGVLFVHIIVEVRLRDTDRGLKIFVCYFHIIMIVLMLCYFANLCFISSLLASQSKQFN